MVEGLTPLREIRSWLLSASWALFRTFPPSYPCSSLPNFLLLFHYYCAVCFFLLLHPCCSHVWGILCGKHTACMISQFPIIYAKWSLVFQSFTMSLQWLKTSLSLIYIYIIWYFNIINIISYNKLINFKFEQ